MNDVDFLFKTKALEVWKNLAGDIPNGYVIEGLKLPTAEQLTALHDDFLEKLAGDSRYPKNVYREEGENNPTLAMLLSHANQNPLCFFRR
jgi:hypothetical protein